MAQQSSEGELREQEADCYRRVSKAAWSWGCAQHAGQGKDARPWKSDAVFCLLLHLEAQIALLAQDGGKAKPLKKASGPKKDLDEDDKAFLAKKKEEAAALKALKEKAGQKGGFAKVKGSK